MTVDEDTQLRICNDCHHHMLARPFIDRWSEGPTDIRQGDTTVAHSKLPRRRGHNGQSEPLALRPRDAVAIDAAK